MNSTAQMISTALISLTFWIAWHYTETKTDKQRYFLAAALLMGMVIF